MPAPRLSAAVGDPFDKGKNVPNRPVDVKLVHEMLLSQGFSLPASDKISPMFIKCIKAVQKKSGLKEPDGIVEPGKFTFKAMMPKYNKMLADIGSGERVLLKDGNKKILISKADYEKINSALLKELARYVRYMEKQYKDCEDLRKSWADSVSGAKGLLVGVSTILVMSAGHVTGVAKLPDISKWNKAKAEIAKAKAAVNSGDLQKIKAAFGPAENAANEMYKEALRYTAEKGGTASTIATGLELTTSIGWAVVGVLATPALVGVGIPATAATVIGAAGTAYVSTYVEEVGKYATGQSDGFVRAIININVATLMAAGTLGISKLQPKFISTIAASFAGTLSRATLGKITTGAAEKYIKNYLMTAGKSALSTAVSEVVAKVRKRMEKGDKFDYEKEIKTSLEKVIRNTVLAPVFDAVGRFCQGFSVRNRDKYVSQVIVANKTLASKVKNNEINPKQLAKLKASVLTKVGSKVVDKVIPDVIDKSSGKENAAQLQKRAVAALLADRDVKIIIDAAIQAELSSMKLNTK